MIRSSGPLLFRRKPSSYLPRRASKNLAATKDDVQKPRGFPECKYVKLGQRARSLIFRRVIQAAPQHGGGRANILVSGVGLDSTLALFFPRHRFVVHGCYRSGCWLCGARESMFDARSTTTRLFSRIPTVQRAAHTGASMTARGAFIFRGRSCPPAPEPHLVLGGYQLVESCQNSDVPTSLLSHRQHRCHRQANIGISGRGLGRGSAAFVTVREIRQQKAVVKWLARQIQSTSR